MRFSIILEGNHLIFAGFLTMRELHKPVHPKLMFAKDWALLSREEQEKATKEGIMRIPTPNEFRKMKSSEFKEWKELAQPILDEIHEGVFQVFNSFPKSLLLVCRLDLIIRNSLI